MSRMSQRARNKSSSRSRAIARHRPCALWAGLASMGESPFALCRAHEDDHDAIIGLIDAAAEWLRTKNTDQWAQPWPSEEDRSHRILRDLIAGKTWIAWQGGTPAATITADRAVNPIWPAETQRDPAVYVVPPGGQPGVRPGGASAPHCWTGLGLRPALLRGPLDPRGCVDHQHCASRLLQAAGIQVLRVLRGIRVYPSAALFQKETSRIQPPGRLCSASSQHRAAEPHRASGRPGSACCEPGLAACVAGVRWRVASGKLWQLSAAHTMAPAHVREP